MADYKKMYYQLLNATESAIRILIQAQEKCEEIYISEGEEETEEEFKS